VPSIPSTTRTEAKPLAWNVGDPVRSIRRPAPAVAVLPAEAADWRRAVNFWSGWSDPTADVSGLRIPTTKPAIRDLAVGSEGRIWVRLHTMARLDSTVAVAVPPIGGRGSGPLPVATAGKRWPETAVYDILQPDGSYVGQVRFPATVVPTDFVAVGDTVWAAFRDPGGMMTVGRFHVRW
jgi:hypothetical protein